MSATKLLVAKAVLATMGVSGGGVALAAATGHLPSNLTGPSAPATGHLPSNPTRPPAPATGHLPSNPTRPHAPASPTASATAMPSADGKPAGHPASSPSPSLRGLCQAYAAHVGASPGKALDNPAFSALITAAGGKDKVAAFCASLLATQPGNRPTSHPGGKPSSLPAPANTTHPVGKPTTVPTAHPKGAPRSHP